MEEDEEPELDLQIISQVIQRGHGEDDQASIRDDGRDRDDLDDQQPTGNMQQLVGARVRGACSKSVVVRCASSITAPVYRDS